MEKYDFVVRGVGVILFWEKNTEGAAQSSAQNLKNQFLGESNMLSLLAPMKASFYSGHSWFWYVSISL